MAELSSAELIKDLKSGNLCSVYYIYGKDILAVENISRAILKKHLGENWNNEVTKISGKNIDISALSDMMEICPMLAQWNAIMVNDLNAEELTADNLDILINNIKSISDVTLLLINVTGFDVKNGKRSVTGKNKKLIDCISKKGIVCECGIKTIASTIKYIIDKAERLGCTISKKTAEMLAEYCLSDSMMIENELEKLCAYRENEEIRPEDIDEIVSGRIETDAFKLSKAIVLINPALAISILDSLIDKKAEPIAVVAALTLSFLDLYRARVAMSSGKRASDVISDFEYKGRSFAVDNAFKDSRRISQESLKECVGILRNADRSLKQTGAVPRIILEKTVTEMLIAVRKK